MVKSCDCGTHWLPWLSNAFLLSRNKHQGLSRVPLSRKTSSPYWNYIDYVSNGDAARFSEPKCLCHNDGDWSFTLFLLLQLCQVCKDYNYFLRKRLWLWGSLEMMSLSLLCSASLPEVIVWRGPMAMPRWPIDHGSPKGRQCGSIFSRKRPLGSHS